MKLTDFNTDNALGYVTANANTTRNDLVELCGLTGKGLAVGVTDYAAVGTVTYGTAQTSAATGQILAQTSIVSGAPATYHRQMVLRKASTGDIFVFTSHTTTNGARLYKYSACGNLAASVSVEAPGNATAGHQAFFLSSGNIAVVYNIDSALKFAIYDTDLVEVKALTSILASTLQNAHFAATALSGGGFAVVYADTANPLISRLVTYDNTGTAVLAATDIWTRTGTNGIQYHKMVQLSSGNLAFAISSANAASSIGLYYGITDTSGAIVKAFTNLDTTSKSYYPEIVSNGAGYFAVSRPNATNQLASVFNDAGTLQGSGFTAATSAGDSTNKTKLVSSGSTMYLIWHRSSDSKTVITTLPITGTGYATTIVTTTTTQYNFYIDAFYEDTYIVGMSMAGSSATSPQIWVIATASVGLVNTAGTTFGTAPATINGQYPRIISGGDRSFIAVYDYTTSAATNICIGKWANTAVLGPAASTTTAGSLIPFYCLAGAYKITAINGAPSKAFDMTTSTLVGNKGTMLAGGSVVLRGIGA